jgi:hypothetical protein
MFKKITLSVIVSVLFGLIFSTFSLAEAKDNTPLNISSQPSSTVVKPKNEDIKNKKITKLKPSEFKIINGEIDNQPDVKMSKDEEKNFKKCKADEKQELKIRYKNRPTACLKKPLRSMIISQIKTTTSYGKL